MKDQANTSIKRETEDKLECRRPTKWARTWSNMSPKTEDHSSEKS